MLQQKALQNLRPGTLSNTAQALSSAYSCEFKCTRRNSRGRRVTTPPPRGRKSRPTMDSIRELFPCLPRLEMKSSSI